MKPAKFSVPTMWILTLCIALTPFFLAPERVSANGALGHYLIADMVRKNLNQPGTEQIYRLLIRESDAYLSGVAFPDAIQGSGKIAGSHDGAFLNRYWNTLLGRCRRATGAYFDRRNRTCDRLYAHFLGTLVHIKSDYLYDRNFIALIEARNDDEPTQCVKFSGGRADTQGCGGATSADGNNYYMSCNDDEDKTYPPGSQFWADMLVDYELWQYRTAGRLAISGPRRPWVPSDSDLRGIAGLSRAPKEGDPTGADIRKWFNEHISLLGSTWKAAVFRNPLQEAQGMNASFWCVYGMRILLSNERENWGVPRIAEEVAVVIMRINNITVLNGGRMRPDFTRTGTYPDFRLSVTQSEWRTAPISYYQLEVDSIKISEDAHFYGRIQARANVRDLGRDSIFTRVLFNRTDKGGSRVVIRGNRKTKLPLAGAVSIRDSRMPGRTNWFMLSANLKLWKGLGGAVRFPTFTARIPVSTLKVLPLNQWRSGSITRKSSNYNGNVTITIYYRYRKYQRPSE